MIVCFSFCESDRPMALELARHIECLGSVQQHQCVLLHPFDVDARAIERHLRTVFGSVQVVTYPPRCNGWPDGPNQCFYVAAKAVFEIAVDEPWLWLEADCVATNSEWLNQVSAEYRFCGQPILGSLNNTWDSAGKVIGQHVTGVAVYPHDFFKTCPALRYMVQTTEQYRAAGNTPPAFDVYLSPYTVKNCAPAKSIEHYWKSFDYREENGVVTCQFRHPYGVSNVVSLNTPLLHGCKDYSLLDIVQGRLSAVA